MRRLTRWNILTASLTSVLLGLFLLGANVGVVPPRATEVAVDLWPLALVACGALLLADSMSKRRLTRSARAVSRRHELAIPSGARTLSCRVHFSYGRLRIAGDDAGPSLECSGVGAASEPTIAIEERGGEVELSVSLGQPLFPSHFQLANTWDLRLGPGLPMQFEVHLHEAALALDLRLLSVFHLDLRADQGAQEILFGARQERAQARIWSSSNDLTIVVPSTAWVEVRLLNPFCRIDYPQGDFERTSDGALVSRRSDRSGGAIEISLDGALRGLVLDVEELPEA